MKAKYGNKSGVDFKAMPALCGGMPPKKSGTAVEKANTPKKAPKSVGN